MLARRVLRLARPKVHVEAMPDYLRFTRLGAVLREYAATGADDASHIAHAVLSTDDMTPLHALRDYMLENPEHPLARRFNWERLPEKVQLDTALMDHASGQGSYNADETWTAINRIAEGGTSYRDDFRRESGLSPTDEELEDSAARVERQHGRSHAASTGRDAASRAEAFHNMMADPLNNARPPTDPERYARRGRPVRKAKADTRHVAHPMVAGFPLETRLRHLANDPANGSSVRELAKLALTGGDTGDATPMALWMLHDALQEHENADGTTGHPALHWQNWMSAGDKVQLDQHTHRALTEAAEDTRRQRNVINPYVGHNPVNGVRWDLTPEHHATRAAAQLTTHPQVPFGRNVYDAELLDRVRGRVAELSPGTPEKDVDESIRRHAVRAHRVFNERHDLPHAAMDRRALLPHGATKELEGMSPEGKANDIAARYRRRQGLLRLRRDRARRYALQSGLAGFHEAMHSEPGNDTHRLVYADWLEDQGHPTIAGMVRDDDDQQETVTPAVGPLADLKPGQFHA